MSLPRRKGIPLGEPVNETGEHLKEMVMVRVPLSMKLNILKAAAKKHMNPGQFIRDALRWYMDKIRKAN